MHRLTEAMKNEIMWMKIVHSGIRTFQNFDVAL